MRFSVIVPLYNKAPYVAKSLRSVLAQTFNDYELIVVNDGSTDDSLSTAEDILRGTPAQIINQDNSGVSTARNNGVALSQGDYICFLDADDWWDKDFLFEMDALINEYPDAGIYGANYYYVKNAIPQQRIHIDTGYFNYFKEYANHMQMPLTSISVAIPKTIFNEFGGFNPILKLGEDFDLWVRIALKYRTCFNGKLLAYYNQDAAKANRGTGRLQSPQYHMLWNLSYLENEEKTNADYKTLIDKLRTYALMPYFLSPEYHKQAISELEKVDWRKQTQKVTREYKRPIYFLRVKSRIQEVGSAIKQWLIRLRYDS